MLKPLDALTPYRLEMSTKLPNSRGKDLYAFWGDSITESLSAELRAAPTEQRFVVNCASQECVPPRGPNLRGFLDKVEASTLTGRQTA